MRIHRLENPLQRYAWGSVDGISRTFGIPNPSGEPLAEVWMGSHPMAPSVALDPDGRRPLDALVRDDPAGAIGEANAARFGPGLPFLFKILSAGTPLSIQAHPEKRKAERGFERENLGGIPLDAPERNYRDPNHKPEMALAITRFELLCGFRPVGEITRAMRLVAPGFLSRQIDRLEANPGRVELSVFFYSLIAMEGRERQSLLETARERVDALLADAGLPNVDAEVYRWIPRIMEAFPGDIGAIAPLWLNLLRLEPGEAVYVAPGELHAHLRGTCLEIMANSDNVIRGALTPKHVDLPELISVLTFDAGGARTLRAQPVSACEERYPSPAPDFAISRLSLDASDSYDRSGAGPEILLCAEGNAELVASGGERFELKKGDSLFVEAAAGGYRLRVGPGAAARAIFYKATVPETT